MSLIMTTQLDIQSNYNSRSEYYPNGLVITESNGRLIAEFTKIQQNETTKRKH